MARPVAVITGASRGIGKQLSIDLAREGWDIVAIARSTAGSPTKLPGTVDETAELARAAGGPDARVAAVGLDIRDDEGVEALARRVADEFGRCDLLVNNAAIAPTGATVGAPMKRWRLAMGINVDAPLALVNAFAPALEAARGRVVNISSSASIMPEFGRASYTVTKRALEALTECLGWELRGRVAVNCIRLELSVYSEGYASTLPDQDFSDFEDPVIMSDAVLWLLRQPLDYTGRILTIADLRAMGAVRPVTRIGDRAPGQAR
jgi:NAD(P)-dependent dehydrogenase (short-subunit alcohol dehydrogenase family)